NGVTLAAGRTLTIRLYFSSGSTSAGRYAMLKDMVVKGVAATLSPVPLQLLSFDGAVEGQHAKLWWRTTNEVNTSHFVIERSSDGRTFTAIGRITSRNMTTLNDYAFTDSAIISGRTYYRLRMVDNDETFKYSAVISIEVKNPSIVAVYPNPAQSTIWVSHPAAGKGTIQIFTANGIKVKELNIVPGTVQTSITISSLSNGQYFVRYSGDKEKATLSFLKQ
ncbi:MAG: T9SS type A sorting domain-containing protein, partial [Flavisolibacter sp.]|nr:T9SS type A sorting domain-containing protein [Flavisolibacter sp.]